MTTANTSKENNIEVDIKALKSIVENTLSNDTFKCDACQGTYHQSYVEVITSNDIVLLVCKECMDKVLLETLSLKYKTDNIRTTKQDSFSSSDQSVNEDVSNSKESDE